MGELSKEVATGCGLMKGEPDPPLKADAEYPSWLFELLQPRATTRELAKAYQEEGLTMDEVRVGMGMSMHMGHAHGAQRACVMHGHVCVYWGSGCAAGGCVNGRYWMEHSPCVGQ